MLLQWLLIITSTASDALKLALFMFAPFRTDRVTSHKDAVSQFRFVLETVAVALCPSGCKDYHIYHDIPPSSFGHLLVTRAQKLPHSSSLSFILLFASLSLHTKKNRALVFCFSLYTHVIAGFLEAVLKEDVATMSALSWGGRRHKIWL